MRAKAGGSAVERAFEADQAAGEQGGAQVGRHLKKDCLVHDR
jgi:hypothetical protein